MEKDGDDDGPVGPTRPVLRINEVSSLLDLETEFLRRKQAATQQTGGGSTSKIGGQFGLLTKEKKGNVFALTKEEKRVKVCNNN